MGRGCTWPVFGLIHSSSNFLAKWAMKSLGRRHLPCGSKYACAWNSALPVACGGGGTSSVEGSGAGAGAALANICLCNSTQDRNVSMGSVCRCRKCSKISLCTRACAAWQWSSEAGMGSSPADMRSVSCSSRTKACVRSAVLNDKISDKIASSKRCAKRVLWPRTASPVCE